MASEPLAQTAAHESAWEQAARRSFAFLFVLVGVLGLGWALSNCREVPPDSRAIVLRFGSVVREVGAGLLLALPRPFEQVMTLPSAERQIEFKVDAFQSSPLLQVSFPPAQQSTAPSSQTRFISQDPRENSGALLTGDMSVVRLDARVFYQITNAPAYVLNSEHVAPALKRLFVAGTVAIIAHRDLDEILVARPDRQSGDETRAGREKLRGQLQAEVNRRLAELADQGANLGIFVSRVDLVPSLPAEAKSAFDSVLFALQRAETTTAEARTHAETAAQRAAQDRDRLLTDAQAGAEERTNQAQARTASISALSAGVQGVSGPMLSNQLYQEQVGRVLATAGRVYAADGAGGARLILPGSTP